jgi:hypothetical protein
MRQTLMSVALLVSVTGAGRAEEREMTVGQELAKDADVPEKLAALFGHVAKNMQVHAEWAGASGTPVAQKEREALERVAREYRAIADAGTRAAAAMRAMRDVPQARRDPARFDRAAQLTWMREKIGMQRAFAALLIAHAELSEKLLAEGE